MKRNFAIDLTTCSKKDRKEAIGLAKENGWEWRYDSRFKDCGANKWNYIYFKGEDEKFNYCHHTALNSSLSLPNDLDKFKEYLGIKEPKKGEVWSIKGKTSTWIFRFNKIDDDGEWYYSQLDTHSGKLDLSVCVDSTGCKLAKATPEEISKLEKAERENGYLWNGEELVKVEYVRRIGGDLYSCWHNKYKGHIFKVVHIDSELDCYVKLDGAKDGEFIADGYYEPATKEEYEAQNNKTGEEFFEVFIDYKAKYYELKKELERLSKL